MQYIPDYIRRVVRRARKDHRFFSVYGGDRWILKGELYEETTYAYDCPHNGKGIATERHPYVSQAAVDEYLEKEQLRKLRRKGIVK